VSILYETVCKCRLAVIYMCDDAEISDMFHRLYFLGVSEVCSYVAYAFFPLPVSLFLL
jgi:hypothetical protein